MLGSRVATLCSVVRLTNKTKRTSIRTDRSASQGNAFEAVAQARLLFTPSTKINIGDLVSINGLVLIVISIQQRFQNLSSLMDHYEVDLDVYGA